MINGPIGSMACLVLPISMPCRDLSSLDIGVKLRIEDTMIPCIACLSNKHLHGDSRHGVMETANRLKQLYIVVAVAATVAATD